jgi:organic radical activating enzyme
LTQLSPVVLDTLTNCLTFVTTYTCTAACEQCCFGCTPDSEGRLSRRQMLDAIDDAYASFPSLQLVVFTGGECFLLKEDLFATIAHATSKGLWTRCVSNGSWGKTVVAANRIAQQCKEAGLKELNFSTGDDHLKYVPFESILNATRAALALEMTVLITVERDSDATHWETDLLQSSDVQSLIAEYGDRFLVHVNSWMPFTLDNKRRKPGVAPTGPCNQVFTNVVMTPHGQISACCGLTYEHIPEMILGRHADTPLRTLYATQLDDFVKVWLRVEGPAGIAHGLLPEAEAREMVESCDHICQLCAKVHQDERIRNAAPEAWGQHVPRVLAAMSTTALTAAAEVGLALETQSAERQRPLLQVAEAVESES